MLKKIWHLANHDVALPVSMGQTHNLQVWSIIFIENIGLLPKLLRPHRHPSMTPMIQD